MTLVIFLVLLSVLVLVHEFGHFWTAKKFGIRVDEFGIGIPPKAKTLFKKDGTEYTLNWLPLGGFVRLYGEDGEVSSDSDKAFSSKPRWQRSVVLMAGVLSNFLLGVAIFSVMYSWIGVPTTKGSRVVVVEVKDGSPAHLSGIREGSVVEKVDGESVSGVDEFVKMVGDRKGRMVSLQIAEMSPNGSVSDDSRIVSLIPRENPPEGEGSLGVVVADAPEVVYSKKAWYKAPFYGLVIGTKEAYAWGREITISMIDIIKKLVGGTVPSDVSGPVGIYKMTGEVRKMGLVALMRFASILSINLAVFNLLPFPSLDGGRLMFVWLEKIVSKKRLAKVEGWIHMVGFGLLILAFLLITMRDLFGR